MAVRPYTGTSDLRGKAKSKNNAIEVMVQHLSYAFGMNKVGTINSDINSPHATGRTFDIRCWDFAKNTWSSTNFEERNWNLIHYLYLHRDYLGVEEIHDYVGLYVLGTMTQYDGSGRGSASNYGAGYRCSRDLTQELLAPTGWMRWSLASHQSHGGDSVGLKHIHVEMSPQSSKSEKDLLSKLILSTNRYLRDNWHRVTILGSGSGAYVNATKVNKVTKAPVRSSQ